MTTTPTVDPRRLAELTEISRAFTYTTSLDTLLPFAVRRAAELLGAYRAVLMLADEEGLLGVHAAHGVPEEFVARFHEPLSESLISRLQGLLGSQQADCFLAVPLVAQGRVIGLLAIMRSADRPCTPEDEWLLSVLADQTAGMIDNARLAGQVERSEQGRRERDRGSEKAMAALANDFTLALRSIHTYVDLLQGGILGPTTVRQRDSLERIQQSAMDLMRLGRGLAKLTRIANQDEPRLEGLSVAAAIHEAILVVRPALESRAQVLNLETDAALKVRGDRERLGQILISLLDNASKFSPPGGRIQVHAAARTLAGECWGTITITDSGPGVPPGERRAIFEPFYRSNPADSSGGAGVGLASALRVVHEMGGDITIEDHPQGGSTFVVRLPMP